MSDNPARWYREQGWRTRLHVGVRWATIPHDGLLPLLPAEGRILDWGTGHGALVIGLAEGSSKRQLTGVDIDRAKIESGRAAAAAAGLARRVAFEAVLPSDRPEGPWDAVVLCDVLYLQAPDTQESIVRAAAAAVRPGGVVVCKEVARSPRWKASLVRLQELVSVKVLRITEAADGLHPFPAPDVVAGWLADEGLDVEQIRLDRRRHVPHVAVVGRRPLA